MLPGDPNDPYGMQPPIDAWTGPVPLPPEWGPLDLPSPAPTGGEPMDSPPDLSMGPPAQLQPGLGIPADSLDALPPMPPDTSAQPPPTSWLDPHAGFGAPAPAPTPPPPDAHSSWLEPQAGFEPSDTTSAINQGNELSTDPYKLAEYKTAHDAERDAIAARDRTAMITRDRESMEAHERVYQEANARTQRNFESIQAEGKRLADEKSGWAGKSTGEKLGGVFAAILGGLVQGKTGGARNTGLDMIDQVIEKDLAERKEKRADINQRLGFAQGQFAHNAANFSHDEAFRQAAYEQAAREVEARANNYDPRGTTMLKHAELVAGIRGQAAASLRKHMLEDREYNVKVSTQNLAVQKRLDDLAQNKQQNALGWANANISKNRLALDTKHGDRDYNLKSAELAQKQEELKQKQQDALATADRELGIGGEMREKTVTAPVADPVTGKIAPKDTKVFVVDQLRDAKGDVWHAPSQLAQQALIKQRGGAQDLIDSLGELKQLNARVGGANKYSSPDDKAEYDRLTNKAVISYATSKGLSLADKQSTDFARDAILGGDASSYRGDETATRIEASIVDATRSYHTALRGNGFGGKLPSFEKQKPPAVLNSAEGASKAIQQGKTPLEDAADAEPGVLNKGLGRILRPFGEQTWEQDAKALEQTGGVDIPGLSIEQEKAAKSLMATAKSTQLDESAVNAARQELVNLASNPQREALHAPLLNYLQDQAPDLFDAAVRKLPSGGEREMWERRIHPAGGRR